MQPHRRRLPRSLAAFASALFLCPLVPARAASISVIFGPEEGATAPYGAMPFVTSVALDH